MRYKLIPFLLLTGSLHAQQTSVLFIGNSYTYANDLPNTLRQLALSLGDTVTVASSTPGGYQFVQHANYAPTLTAIASQPWDHVVLQEQSQLGALPFPVTTTQASAAQLVDTIRAHEACSMPVFYMTWGRQNGDDLNCPDFPFMCTYQGMQDALIANYTALAEENDAFVAPVGAAWSQVRALHPLIELYSGDGSHPSPAGTYLAACVFYCTLFEESCVNASFNGSIDAATAAILRGIASEVVLDDLTAWNLDVDDVDASYTSSTNNGWNAITYTHGGAGTHLWTSSDGQSYTTPDATFVFSAGGSYTISHTYTDPCGNSDTETWVREIVVGVEELEHGMWYRVYSGVPGQLEVRGLRGGEVLTLFDAQGRSVLQKQLSRSAERVMCLPGMYFWRVNDERGNFTSGSVVVR